MIAFEHCVEQHGPTVLLVCRAVLGAGADAEDVWSETFLAALRAWPDLDPTTNVEAWLVRVAKNKAIDITRGRNTPMNDQTTSEDARAVRVDVMFPKEQGILARLHSRLEHAAREAGILDVAYRTIDTPIGVLLLAATEQGLVRVAFEREGFDDVLQQLAERTSSRILHSPARLDDAARQFHEYFGGSRREFDLRLDHRLSAGFRQAVQLSLPRIGYGQTLTYKRVAELVGRPNAVRAVGSACATNPLPVVLPCHRVLRSDGSLGGYLGGLAAKSALLELERATRLPRTHHPERQS